MNFSFSFDIPYLASVAVMALLLTIMGFGYMDWQFWCVIAIQWVSKQTGMNAGTGQARIETLALLKMAETDLDYAQSMFRDLTGIDPKDYKVEE
jgi:hypothetical protein